MPFRISKHLRKGGVSGIIVENNYDIPHRAFVSQEVSECLEFLTGEILRATKLPMGISVLWNDFRTALSISKKLGLKFIRVPVFVDTVRTDCGKIIGNPIAVRQFRKKIGAEHVLLFADIHVKHAKLLSSYTLVQSARRAFQFGADGVIVTGNWTGQAPRGVDLRTVRSAIGPSRVLLAGSGANMNNVSDIFRYANAVIVSTALKSGNPSAREINVKNWKQRISLSKVRQFVRSGR